MGRHVDPPPGCLARPGPPLTGQSLYSKNRDAGTGAGGATALGCSISRLRAQAQAARARSRPGARSRLARGERCALGREHEPTAPGLLHSRAVRSLPHALVSPSVEWGYRC